MICSKEQQDIDAIVGQLSSQKDFLEAELDVISLGFTVEDLAVRQYLENDKIESLPRNIANTIGNPSIDSSSVVPLENSFKTKSFQSKNYSNNNDDVGNDDSNYDNDSNDNDDNYADNDKCNDNNNVEEYDDNKVTILPSPIDNVSTIEKERPSLALPNKEDQDLFSRSLREPLSFREKELIQRAFVLGAVKAHGRSKKIDSKRKMMTNSADMKKRPVVDVSCQKMCKSTFGEDDSCLPDIEWNFDSYEYPLLEDNPLMAALGGMDDYDYLGFTSI